MSTVRRVHPRLFARPEDFTRIDERFSAAHEVARKAHAIYHENLATASVEATITSLPTGHNWHLIRARELQTRIVTLMVEYLRGGDETYRRVAIEHLRMAAGWEYWSWIDWRSPEPSPTDPYDLSFGELGMTFGLAWDWLYETLSADERELLRALAQRHTSAYLSAYETGKNWWADRQYSNWTAVTCGGAGMLALSMHEELDAAEEILSKAEAGIEVFFGSMDDDGGWPEGAGYWNYGMRYGYLYLLSHEAATGSPHPLFEREAVRQGALFPLLFCPHGCACGFGDVNRFSVLAFHYRVLERLGLTEFIPVLDRIAGSEGGLGESNWPTAALYGLLARTTQPAGEPNLPANRLLSGIEWGYMSDAMPNPHTYMSIRGGTAKVPHGHPDLMAFWYQVDDEQFLINAWDGRYLDTTFSAYRTELYGCSPFSKNTILLNGIGVRNDATSHTRAFEHEGLSVIKVDASDCFGQTQSYGATWLDHCARTFINLGDDRYLLIDQVRFTTEGQFEARFHTFLPVEIEAERTLVSIQGEKARLRVRMACDQPLCIREGRSCPVLPARPADTIIQVQSERLVDGITLVTLLDTEHNDGVLTIDREGGRLTVRLGEHAVCTVPVDDNGTVFGHIIGGGEHATRR